MKNFSKLLATLSLSTILVAGCSTASTSSSSSVSTSAAQTPINLKVWGAQEDQVLLKALVTDFIAANPGKTWNITFGVVSEGDAKTQVLGDIELAGDIFSFPNDQLIDLANAGALYEITRNKDAIIAANGAGSIEASTIDGKLFAYPTTADNGYFIYFDKRTITPTQAGKLDDILAAANAADAKFAYGVSNSWYLAGFFLGAGNTIGVDDAGKGLVDFNNTTGLNVAKTIETLVASPAFFNTGDNDVIINGFKNRTFAAAVSGTWLASGVTEALGENMGVAKLPTMTLNGQQVQMGSFAGYKLMGVKRTTKHPSEAMQLAEFLTNEQSQITRFQVRALGPSNKVAAASEAVLKNPVIAALSAQGAYATSQKYVPGNYWGPAEAFGATLVSKDYGGKTLQELLDKLVADVQA
jgi:arabinogalactan oligomer/maltooligosaccharide transport system substrate-binding protein